MDEIKIWSAAWTRSEWGPLSPLIKEAEKHDDIDLWVEKMNPGPIHSPHIYYLMWKKFEPDIVLCGFDRPEMPPLAYNAYQAGYPVAQLFAGDIAGGATDDRHRFVISNYADLIFCATHNTARRVRYATNWRRDIENPPQIHVVGATHHDDMEVAEPHARWMDKPYALVLYNPPSLAKWTMQMVAEVKECYEEAKKYKKVVWVAPNGDFGSDAIKGMVKSFGDKDLEWMENMPRSEYLALMKYSKAVIGNSSSMFYEAPYFNTPIKQVGIRNKYREKMPHGSCLPGASEQILSIIRSYIRRGREGA